MAAILEQTDFTRISWPVDEIIWHERSVKVAKAWKEVEILSVLDSVRRCAFVFMSPEELRSYPDKYTKLIFMAIQKVPKRDEYINSGIPWKEGDPFDWRVVVSLDELDLDELKVAWEKQDNRAIGGWLGFPQCCVEGFSEHWGRGYRDPIFLQLVAAGASGIELTSYSFSCNLMLRYLGVRAVPHLPCSMRCDETETLAYQLGGVFRKYGFDQENEWLREMLKMPMQYSTLHGICEIVTPFCKITASSDHLNVKHWMKLGSSGDENVFLKVQDPEYFDRILDTWTANGFKSKADMDRNHKFITELVEQIKYDSILDLGCGNGELVRKLVGNKKGMITAGIDLVIHPNRVLGTHLDCGIDKYLESYNLNRKWDLILIAEQRLDEVQGGAFTLLDKIYKIAKFLIVYNYDDLKHYRNAGQIAYNPKATLIALGK